MLINKQELQKLFPRVKDIDKLHSGLEKYLPEYHINTKERVCMFLAQYGHETGGFTALIENMNYSAERLLAVFPKYFKSIAEANQYARKPDMIASYVYGNRMGNGSPASKDGWNFRGRGVCHLTGRANYTACSQDTKLDLIGNPDLACELDTGILVGCWYWEKRGLNNLADKKDMTLATKAINGGVIGIKERQSLYNILIASKIMA